MRWITLAVVMLAMWIAPAGCTFSTAGIGQGAAPEGGAGDVGIDAPVDAQVEAAADQSVDGPRPELPTIIDGGGDSSVDSTADSSVDTASGLPLGTLCLRDQDCASGACVSKIRSFISICCAFDCKPDEWEEGCTPTGQHCQE